MIWIYNICGCTYDSGDFTKEVDDYLYPLCDSGRKSFQQCDLATEIIVTANQYFVVEEEK